MSPTSETDYPMNGWLYIASKPYIHGLPSAGGQIGVYPHYSADIRAQRKVDRGVLYAYFDNITAFGTTQPLRVYGRVRSLVLL